MDQAFVLLTPALLAAVPVVIGVVSAFKSAGLPSQYAPLTALVLGVVASFVFPAATVAVTVFSGVAVGLAASGLYSGVKTTATVKTKTGEDDLG